MTIPLPLSPDPFICDSSHQEGLVDHTTSWLTVNLVMGCPLDCCYCFRHKWHSSDRPTAVADVEESVRKLLSHPLFVPHETPLSVNISSTDALLPQAKRSTFRVAQILDSMGYMNIFGITSKVGVTDDDIAFFRSLRSLRLVVLVTYSRMPTSIEPYPAAPRLRGLRRLAEAEIPRILYARPLVEGWNDGLENLRHLVRVSEELAQAVVIGGLRVSPEILAEITRKGVEVPSGYNNFNPKRLSPEIEERFLWVHHDEDANVPIFKHTSCAVSFLFGRENYNHLFKDVRRNCLTTCPRAQQARCGVSVASELL